MTDSLRRTNQRHVVTIMRIIDRYLIRQFLRAFIATFVSLLGLYVIADFMGNLTEFIDHGRNAGNLWKSVAVYYAARLPWFFDAAGRVVVLLAAVFSIGSLHRHNEMTALMAAGISRWRITKPLVIVGLIISLLGVVNREMAIPRARESLCRTVQDLVRPKSHELMPQYDHETVVLFEGQGIRYQDRVIERPRFLLPHRWGNLGRNVTAESAAYRAATDKHPSGYLLDGVTPWDREAPLDSFYIQQREVILTPRHHPWLEPDQCFLVSTMTVEQLRKGRQWQQFSSTLQLMSGLKNRSIDFGADARVLIHARLVQPFLDMSLLLLGLPVALAAERRSVFLATGKTIGVILLFSIVVLVSQGLGIHYLISPALAAWSPLFVTVPVAILMSGPLFR